MADEEQPPVQVVINPNSPVVFVDELMGGGNLGPNVNLTFCVIRYDYTETPPRPYREVALQIVMPRGAFEQAAAFIGSHVLGEGAAPNAVVPRSLN